VAERFRVGFLPPGVAPPEGEAGREPLSVRDLLCERVSPTADVLGRTAVFLSGGGSSLGKLPAGRILTRLGAVHAAWGQPDSPYRRQAVAELAPATGYHPETLDRALLGLFRGLTAERLEQWLRAAGIQPEDLDPLTPGRTTRVLGPRLTLVVASGNVPGAALPSVVQALLLKSPVLVKLSREEPVLLSLYARSLAELAPELAHFVAMICWDSAEDAERARALLPYSGAVVVYGGGSAVSAWRNRLSPGQRFLGYGHRLSIAAVGREQLTRTRAPRAAALAVQDAVRFDQQGCLSPQWWFVETGGEVEPAAWASLVVSELELARDRTPRRVLTAGESAALHQYRTETELRALREPGLQLWCSDPGTEWTLLLDPSLELRPGPLNRTVVLHAVPDLNVVPVLLGGLDAVLLSASLGVDGARRPALADELLAAGFTRICPLGQAQDPRDFGLHDGLNGIAALARYGVVEPDREGAGGS